MSNIKRLLHSYENETGEVPTLEELLEWMDGNEELFQYLPHPNPEDVMGYEE